MTDASRELREAARYYNSHEQGLGAEFLEEFERSKKSIQQFPRACAKLDANVRPEYWKDRI